MKRSVSRSLAFLAAAAVWLCMAACSVPFAPGYHIARETRHIRFVPGNPPRVAIRTEYLLVNAGNGELHFVDVRLPSVNGFGRIDLRVRVDGRAVVPAQLPPPAQRAGSNVVRITLEKPWMRKQKRELDFDYTLRSPANSDGSVTIGPSSFYLGLRGWAPALQPPTYLLSTYPSRPSRVDYTVQVPDKFAILAGGARKKNKRFGDETEYRYELRAEDLGPYVVAGRYVKWPAKGTRAPAQFLTMQALSGNPTQSAQQIADAWKTLNVDFGVLDKHIRRPDVAESSEVQSNAERKRGPAAVGFPGGALVNPPALALGIDNDRFLAIVSEALARGWFDGAVLPSAGAKIGMGEGLPEYASIVTEEARKGPLARRQRIYEYLSRYDSLTKHSEETPIAATTFASPLAQRRIALAKAPLFYIELEDACGEAPVRAGLAHLVSSMRGQEVDYNVLRSVLEESTGRDLAKIFRQWLHQKGIPKNFRARYPYGEGSEETGD